MIRSEVMGWATIFLVILFAFVLIPTHERFTTKAWEGPNTAAAPSDGSNTSVTTPKVGSFLPSPEPTNIKLVPSITPPIVRISSTLGVGNPLLSGMNAAFTSGVIPPSGYPWPGAIGNSVEMFTNPTPPSTTGTVGVSVPPETTEIVGLYGPGPNVLRKDLVGCTCASQTKTCPVHTRRRYFDSHK